MVEVIGEKKRELRVDKALVHGKQKPLAACY